MVPQRPEPANGSRKAKPSLDIPESELALLLEQYCDLRHRGFSQTEIRTRLQLKRQHPSMLLSEAAGRGMPGSQENQSHNAAEWLITMFDAGVEISAIRRMSALTERGIKQRLKRALDAASGNPPRRLITPAPDGTRVRVSWLAPNGRLMHRAFDRAFPQGFPQRDAVAQCQQVLLRLIAQHDQTARKRAVTMLAMAEDNLHTFDYEPSRRVNHILERAGVKGLGISNHRAR